jgi:uncharacterized membrane protein (UPF0136 family)
MVLTWTIVVFGILTIAGGVLDFFRTKRIRSLAIPGVIGFIICGFGAIRNADLAISSSAISVIVAILAAAMALVFINRFRRKESHFTDALMIVFSFACIALLLIDLFAN